MGRGETYLRTLFSRQKEKSNKDGEKGRELTYPQCLLPQIQKLSLQTLAKQKCTRAGL